ncbi:MAG: InlB B-repeat-containing protein, partial [Clostridia bacterium]|nr:InlB B-repeat-containing protein [Clostridia bacterium]
MIDKCSVSGKIIGYGRSGGILGQVNGGFEATIKNSFCDAEVTGIYEGYEGTTPTAGGLVGFLNNGTIAVKDCFFAGTAPTARASGMAGPIINHDAGGVFSCINTYYDSDKNAAEADGHEYGTPATSAEFADGTVTALLNGDSEEPIYEQGDTHPIFYVKVCTHENTHIVEAVASTCVTQGHGEYTVCDDCGIIVAGSDELLALDPDNHVNTEIRDAKAATCTEAGYTGDTYCNDCKEIIAIGKEIVKTAHTPAAAVKENVKEASCTADGSYDEVVRCSVCGEKISSVAKTIAKLAHTPAAAVKENEKAATCTADGSYDEVVKCSVCGKKISSEAKTIAKLAHKPSNWKVVKAAAIGVAGSKQKVCTVCKAVLETATIDALPYPTYTITYKLDGGKNASGNPKTYKYNAADITLKNPTKKGYKFEGWYIGTRKVTKIAKGTNKNITLTAKWSKVTYKISYKLAGGKAVKNPATYTVTTSTIKLKNPTKKGYKFKGWYNGTKKVTEIKKGSTGNLTLTAKWTVITYKITYKLAGGKNNSKNP